VEEFEVKENSNGAATNHTLRLLAECLAQVKSKQTITWMAGLVETYAGSSVHTGSLREVRLAANNFQRQAANLTQHLKSKQR
jgi:hypothetical protein